MHLRIKQKNLRLIGGKMTKEENNLSRRTLRNTVRECDGDDLLTSANDKEINEMVCSMAKVEEQAFYLGISQSAM